jgi:hypothetical protein
MGMQEFFGKVVRKVRLPGWLGNKFFALLARRPNLRLAVLGTLLACVVAILVFAYLSLFTYHPSTGSKELNPAETKRSASVSLKSNTIQTQPRSNPPSTASKPPSSTANFPADVLSLTQWKLTLPTGPSHDATEIQQPQLASFELAPYFQLDAAKDGVQFEAPVNGSTTSGSQYPRSELREMTDNGRQEASWSTTDGTNTMTVREAITHLPASRSQVVAAQIHGSSAYVMLIRLNGSDLFVEGDNGKNMGDLDTNYRLGTAYTVQITAMNGRIIVSYNGIEKANFANVTSGDYFKAGCYTQANMSNGGSASDYGQVIVYGLSVQHS